MSLALVEIRPAARRPRWQGARVRAAERPEPRRLRVAEAFAATASAGEPDVVSMLGAGVAAAREMLHGADRAALVSLEEALLDARGQGDERPAFTVIAGCLEELGVELPKRHARGCSLAQARDEWLRRERSAGRSKSTLTAYRVALDDLLAFLDRSGLLGAALDEATIVAYLDEYRRRAEPAPATYYRRFILLRRFFRWLSRRYGVPDPFLELEPPPKQQQEAVWLTREEFGRMLAAAGSPQRKRPGLAERDQLVLLVLVTTGLRRSELLALNWGDLDLESERPSLLVRCGKGGKPRRQPLPAALAETLARRRASLSPGPDDAVFCGLAGKRLTATILAGIVKRAAAHAGIDKHVTVHTLRHTAATWLRQATGDARLVAAYLGHADLSTVSRYTHVAPQELHGAAEAIASRGGLDAALAAAGTAAIVEAAERSDAGTARKATGRAPAPSGSKRDRPDTR